jgi:hypothetical protein
MAATLHSVQARRSRALDDLENLWALAAWRAGAEVPADSVARLAA